ncbi:adenylate/guanylate cyclase domain-containing protein [Hyphomicrobium sp.]|uniref:CHASE2 domain-containing protein n=1 Tax=Hyphomicrobium sp. TaxID=82 RepID=UPI001D59A3D9|nr:adenylate/guanylate cyclase domain-containing protein [Hyphomicrobium sp.]MBY0561364.1 adenylate/guanylate cyclase domain-containing protein [Hyphomicrobium sp.]
MNAGLSRLPLALLISVALLATCLALRIADPEPVARLRLSAFDTYLRAAPRQVDPSFPVRIVAIDEASLAAVGQWPWPRTKLADLVSKLVAAGAASVTFDMVFAEPDRLSPEELLRSLADDAGQVTALADLGRFPSNDARLAAAIEGAPVVLGVAGNAIGSGKISPYPAAVSYAGDDPLLFVHAFAGGVENLPGLTKAARGVGAVNWLPSSDQVVRRIPLLVSIGGSLYPSLALEALRIGTKQSTIFIKSSGGSGVEALGQKTGVESVRVGDTVLPSDGRGELWLKFAPSDPRRTISALSIFDGTANADDIKSRHMIIGATATGLLDLRATPLEPAVPGVEVHAQALEQMLSGDHLVRPAYASGAELTFLLVVGVLVTWLIERSGALRAAIVGLTSIAFIVLLSWLAYSRAGLLFDPVYPSLSVALLYFGVSLTSFIKSEIQRAEIRSAFGHYVAAPLVEELARNRDKLKLGGETREVTLLFADVRGFSKISEGLQADELIRFVNRLFTPLTDVILGHSGTIDKFMGDAVMAFWNAPVHDANHASNACRAALAMLDRLASLNDALRAEAVAAGAPFVPVRLGIGLNTGECVVGNVGSPQRFDYSVLGDVVNVAARFEESTKMFGARIVVGERTAAQAPQFAFLELGSVTPRGKDRPENVFALLGDETYAASEAFLNVRNAHVAFLAARQAGDPRQAEEALAACMRSAPEDMVAYYRNSAREKIAT